MAQRVPDLRRRLELALGRNVDKTELQSDILIELLEILERLATERQNDERA